MVSRTIWRRSSTALGNLIDMTNDSLGNSFEVDSLSTADSDDISTMFDIDKLERHLKSHIDGWDGAMEIELIQGGRSNLTFTVTDGARSWVLRRAPLGPIAPTANNIPREAGIMDALGNSDVPVPSVDLIELDDSIIGAPFSVVEHIDGHVIRSTIDGAALTHEQAQRCGEALVAQLIDIHNVDFEAVGLGSLGRPAGYIERQVSRWGQQWGHVSDRQPAEFQPVLKWLQSNIPVDSDAALVHGDFRVDNTIVSHDDPAKILAVIDWEMATLGDPLADLGLLVAYWDPVCTPLLADGHAIAANPGFQSAEKLIEMYAADRPFDIDLMSFYVSFAYFKLAVIAEGIHQRYRQGLTIGEGFETSVKAPEELLRRATELIRG